MVRDLYFYFVRPICQTECLPNNLLIVGGKSNRQMYRRLAKRAGKISSPSSISLPQGNDVAGVVTGLAWTQVGGDILFIETSISRGKGKLTLTGNLGDVMKESAVIALEYLRGHSDVLGLNPELFDHYNVHVHVPEGATPKDGPSAGIAMLTALASAFTQRKVKKNLAMTGEITLRGRVLAVGGIREKILAAKRAGIKEVILCVENKKDIEEINPAYLKGITFHYVEKMGEVLDYALLKEKVKNPRVLSFPGEAKLTKVN